jgi:hypothetical protein
MTDDLSPFGAPLERERSVPVSGFSRELRGAEDVERYRFDFALAGAALSPVHLMFSASLRTAEVKAGDLKAFHLVEVDSVEEARRRWVEWWRAGRPRLRFQPPRRTGNFPVARPSPDRFSPS